MPAKYQIYKDKDGKFRFRLRDDKDDIVAVSEAYKQYDACRKGVESVQKNCQSDVEDTTAEGKKLPNPKYEVFSSKDGFRFHLKAANGEIIAASEGYKTKEACIYAIEQVKKSCAAEIEDPWAAKKPETEAKAAPAIAAVVPPVIGVVETKLELEKLPEMAKKDDILTLKGKLVGSKTGEGITGAVVRIMEHDRSFAIDEHLAEGGTCGDGSFSIDWKVRRTDWWDGTSEIFAEFLGNRNAKPSRSEIQSLKVK